jgi:hypothetical protein
MRLRRFHAASHASNSVVSEPQLNEIHGLPTVSRIAQPA